MTSLKIKQLLIVIGLLLSTSACQITSKDEEATKNDERLSYTLNKPFLDAGPEADSTASPIEGGQQDIGRPNRGFERLQSITRQNVNLAQKVATQNVFARKDEVKISANNMSVSDFIHYVFGEILEVNYVVDGTVKEDQSPVTLNIQNTMPSNEIYSLVAKLLAQKQILIEFNESTFFFHKQQESKGAATVGVGRDYASVPNASGQILQVVQLHYGIKITLERTLNQLVDAQFIPDFDQNAMFVLGNRTNVIRALELINMLDVPAHRGKFIGLLSLEYIPMDEFTNQVVTLLTNEGIDAAINNSQNKSVLLVPLSHIGAVAVFASSEESLARVQYWASVLDRPSQGENVQYFIYSPKYARASDLGESISGLMGISVDKVNKNSTGNNAAQNASQRRASGASSAVSGLSFVVDERTNSIIFNTSGDKYLKILPLLNKLDVLPRQILLEVMIAEVTLTDNFRYGVEFALQNDDRFNLATAGLGATSGAMQISLADADLFGTTSGSAELAFFSQNSLVNVLSNPTLLVRDGMTANIQVGTEIPIVSASIAGQGLAQQNIEYTQTGVQLTVTPTLNSQGVVIMTINQTISNVTDSSADAPAPSIFNRTLSTEAVVESGKTVLLGGLISENSSKGDTEVPLLADLPLIGNVFRGQTDSIEKTELVMIVTPRVIKSSDEWDKLMDDFAENLQVIKLEK